MTMEVRGLMQGCAGIYSKYLHIKRQWEVDSSGINGKKRIGLLQLLVKGTAAVDYSSCIKSISTLII
mgnify:CR=1 FL=1